MSKAIGVLLAVELLAGCSAAPSGPFETPQPMPRPATGAPSPKFSAGDGCGKLAAIQVIVQDKQRMVTARNGDACVAVYKPFTHERVGTLGAHAVFGAVCNGPVQGTWEIHYGDDYQEDGAVFVEPDFVTNAEQAGQPVEHANIQPLFGCDEFPHAPFITD